MPSKAIGGERLARASPTNFSSALTFRVVPGGRAGGKARLEVEGLETRDFALALVLPSTAVIQGIKMWPVSL